MLMVPVAAARMVSVADMTIVIAVSIDMMGRVELKV